MLSALFLAGLIAAGAPAPALVVSAFAVAAPPWFLVAAGIAGATMRVRAMGRSGMSEEVAMLNGMAAELRAGASLRGALVAGADRAPGLALGTALRLAAAGRPIAEVAVEVRGALPATGRLAAACLDLSATTGARSADLFGRLAALAAANGRLARERKALTAQARLSALLVGGVPLAFAAAAGISGRAGALLLTVGGGLIAAGALVMWLMIRRAER